MTAMQVAMNFTREVAIQELVDNDFSDIFNLGQDQGEMLESMLRYGFKGYDNYTDVELYNELVERGINLEPEYVTITKSDGFYCGE